MSLSQEQLEAQKAAVLAECERLNGLEKTPHPFRIWRDAKEPDFYYFMHLRDKWGLDVFKVWTGMDADDPRWEMASRLLQLGRQQPASIELVWDRDEINPYGWTGHSKFVCADVSKNLQDMETFNWSASYNVSSERVDGNCPTLEEAIDKAKNAALGLVTKHISIAPGIRLESLYGGKTALTIFRGIEGAIAECAKNETPIVTGFEVDLDGEAVTVMRVFITANPNEDPISRLAYWRDRALKAESSPALSVRAKPIEWGEWEISPENVSLFIKQGDEDYQLIRIGDGPTVGAMYQFLRIIPNGSTEKVGNALFYNDETAAIRVCVRHKQREVDTYLSKFADISPAKDTQPLADALKEISDEFEVWKETYGDDEDAARRMPIMGAIAQKMLKSFGIGG